MVRHLRCGDAPASPCVSLERPATIESAPGGLDHFYNTHQAIDLMVLESEYPVRERRDGLALRSADPNRPLEIAEAERLADIVNAGARTPDLVHAVMPRPMNPSFMCSPW